jgi:hypothetical protein
VASGPCAGRSHSWRFGLATRSPGSTTLRCRRPRARPPAAAMTRAAATAAMTMTPPGAGPTRAGRTTRASAGARARAPRGGPEGRAGRGPPGAASRRRVARRGRASIVASKRGAPRTMATSGAISSVRASVTRSPARSRPPTRTAARRRPSARVAARAFATAAGATRRASPSVSSVPFPTPMRRARTSSRFVNPRVASRVRPCSSASAASARPRR